MNLHILLCIILFLHTLLCIFAQWKVKGKTYQKDPISDFIIMY
jgi:hypothetical protein